MKPAIILLAVLVIPLLAACSVESPRDGPADADLIAAAGNEYLDFVADQDPYLKFHPRAR